MRRDRLDHAELCAALEPERLAATPRERQRSLRVGALHGQFVGRLRFEYHRRSADRYPETAEAACPIAGDREHAQVEASGRLHAYPAHQPPITARMWRLTYSIASRSRDPPVLS